jgi:LysR family transcriptional regulator, low CO2-responsive transcriptional regulator
MNISLHHLRILQAVADQKSITKASVSLNMSQPAVSIQLKNLQDQFEIPLTEIIGKQILSGRNWLKLRTGSSPNSK